jgi:hypothetical protein
VVSARSNGLTLAVNTKNRSPVYKVFGRLGCVNLPLCLEKHTQNMFEMRPFDHVLEPGRIAIWLPIGQGDKRYTNNT